MTEPAHLAEFVHDHLSRDFVSVPRDATVESALDIIRGTGGRGRPLYFYVVDDQGKLAGVLSTRTLLTATPDEMVADLMDKTVVAIPEKATLLDACEFFVLYKYYSFPVLGPERKVLGVLDVSAVADQIFGMESGGHPAQGDSVFETIGFHIEQVRNAGAFRVFRVRFPWLMATVASGCLCAWLTSRFEGTLAESIVLAFFLTLVLGITESASVQSLAVTVQALQSMKPTMKWYRAALLREIRVASLMAGGAGCVVFALVSIWRHDILAAGVISVSVFSTICIAAIVGLSVPSALHALRLDPKIAAGPITLAIADIFALSIYFTLGSLVLHQ